MPDHLNRAMAHLAFTVCVPQQWLSWHCKAQPGSAALQSCAQHRLRVRRRSLGRAWNPPLPHKVCVYAENQSIPSVTATAQKQMNIVVLQIPSWTRAKAQHVDRKIIGFLFISRLSPFFCRNRKSSVLSLISKALKFPNNAVRDVKSQGAAKMN